MNAVALPAQITQRVIQKPKYVVADTYAHWLRLNHYACYEYWCEIEDRVGNDDGDRAGQISDFMDFAKSQFDIHCATAEEEENEEASPRLFRSTDEAAAYEAGVLARGEI